MIEIIRLRRREMFHQSGLLAEWQVKQLGAIITSTAPFGEPMEKKKFLDQIKSIKFQLSDSPSIEDNKEEASPLDSLEPTEMTEDEIEYMLEHGSQGAAENNKKGSFDKLMRGGM